ncbi:hypothetical protein M9435_003749 [Picochlorum sp. BPE23]|nr:hypothetical protein M9435_003749 [Picochlorum sp. BPE23]
MQQIRGVSPASACQPRLESVAVRHTWPSGARRQWRIQSSDLDEIDPMTGEVIEGTARARTASNTVSTGRFTHAYRGSADSNASLPVVCAHGLGSSSYSFRKTVNLLEKDGVQAMAFDFLGHGASDHPSSSEFPYTQHAYISELQNLMETLYGDTPVVLFTHGYILGQYAMLYAARNPDRIAKLVTLNVPLGLKSKLRPELAQYKSPIPFLKPKENSPFDGRFYNAAGGPYALSATDADAYNAPYEQSPNNASAAIWHTMENCDWEALKKQVDEEFVSFQKPTLLIHGNSDSFLDVKGTLDWLEEKRTNMKMCYGIEAKLGHMPQEDYPEAIHPVILEYITST